MKPFDHIICFEFKKYSACFQAIQALSESKYDQKLFVLEVTPTPFGGILLLSSNELDLINKFYHSMSIHLESEIVHSAIIDHFNQAIFHAYLSQNKPVISSEVNFFETDSVCLGFLYAQKVTNRGGQIIDLRILRSSIHKTILIYDGEPIDQESVVIRNPSKLIQSYF